MRSWSCFSDLPLRLVAGLLLLIFSLFACVDVMAQQPQPFHAKSGAAWIAVVLPDHWQQDPVSVRLVNDLERATPDTPLGGWTRTAKVDKRIASDPICKERHGRYLRPDELPAIFLQRSDGGTLYKATRPNLPTDPFVLGREMDYYASLDPVFALKGQVSDSKQYHGAIDWVTQCPGPNCPDGMCPVNPSYPVGPMPVGPMLPDSRLSVPSGISEPSPLIVAAVVSGVVLLALALNRKGGSS